MSFGSVKRLPPAGIDLDEARAVPITAVLARLGFELRRCGSNFDTHCPFCSPDSERGRGRRTLRAYLRSRSSPGGSVHCFRCHTSADAIKLVERCRGLGFADAVHWIVGAGAAA